MTTDIGKISITPELVQQLQKERARCYEAINNLRQKANAIEEILSGAQVVSPEAFEDAPTIEVGRITSLDSSSDEAAEHRRGEEFPNMPTAILTLLTSTPGGLSRRDLRSQLEHVYPSLKLGKDGVYYYRSVRRMVGDGRLRETKGGRLKLAT